MLQQAGAGAGVQVAALEVQNVKRAINRYGTLPKGARIGAYLESLRQSGAPAPSPAAPHPAPPAPPALAEEARSLSPRTGRAAPHMIRSNSSGGVTGAPASPRAPRAAPPAPRGFASPAKPRPRVAELEFPPPPPDLPPPPEQALPPPPPPASDKRAMKEMLELKLVAEIKERADKKRPRAKDSPPPPEPARHQDPVTRLVSELSESLRLQDATAPFCGLPAPPSQPPLDLKASLRKTSFSADFKAQLKKIDVHKKGEEGPRSIIDLKARLRKVESASSATNGRERPSPDEGASAGAGAGAAGDGVDEEDKRRSTGSISSLKKLWESKESEERLSPKPGEGSPEERVRRPALACKPRKPPGIYATPQQQQAAAADDDDEDLLAALRISLDCTANEVSDSFFLEPIPIFLSFYIGMYKSDKFSLRRTKRN